jgi:hypothetical protein
MADQLSLSDSVTETEIPTELIVGNFLLNLIDLYGLYLLYNMLKLQKTSPVLKARRPWLISTAVIYNFVYNWVWTIDNLLYSIRKTGGVTCGAWELADGIYNSLAIEIVLLRAVILAAIVRFTSQVKGMISFTFHQTSKEIPKALGLSADLERKLQRLKWMSGFEFGLGYVLVALVLHLIPYFFDWRSDLT